MSHACGAHPRKQKQTYASHVNAAAGRHGEELQVLELDAVLGKEAHVGGRARLEAVRDLVQLPPELVHGPCLGDVDNAPGRRALAANLRLSIPRKDRHLQRHFEREVGRERGHRERGQSEQGQGQGRKLENGRLC